MSLRENFKEDLSWGEKWERIVGLYLSINGVSIDSYNNDYRYDIKGTMTGIPTKWEIKTDKYPKTGNMAIEIRDAGKPSGISRTEADVFIYTYTNISDRYVYLFFIDVKDLKSLIRDNFDRLKIVKGGDDNESEMVLIPMKRFQTYFKVETIDKKTLNLPNN
tara:strand:- start:175 stop:660 length:486 start_codon:yes stop_codon:yes gene_type:complete